VVTEIGLDHYFRAPDIDIRTVALTYAIFEELARREAATAAGSRGAKLDTDTDAEYEPLSTGSTVGHTH